MTSFDLLILQLWMIIFYEPRNLLSMNAHSDPDLRYLSNS